MNRFFAHRRSLGALLLLAATLTGCVSIEQAAPPIAMLGLSGGSNLGAMLEQGRTIYITRCAKCHAVEPVRRYSRSEWDTEILPSMSDKTKLNTADAAAVRAYVMAVLQHPTPTISTN